MNRFINNRFVPLMLVILIYLVGPDFLSILLNGMPLEEGGKYYAGNGWAYLGRDLDFKIEGCTFFEVDSIWRLMPLKIVLPQIQDLIFIGIFQIICLLLLTRYFYFNHRILKEAHQTKEFSQGRSLRLSLVFVVGLGLILFSTEIIYFGFFRTDFIFETLVDNNINQQKLNLHPLYFMVFLFVGCLGAAIFEETFFRRILFPLFRKKMPFLLSAILNAMLFASFHEFSWLIFLQTFICGLICCVIYEHSKSIIGCIFFHFSGNFCLLVLPTLYPLDVFQ